MQIIQIEIPETPPSIPGDEIQAPPEVMRLLKNSCYACHSNNTNFPWYSNIAPMSFSIRSHVKDGRGWLNYNIWNTYTQAQKIERLEQTIHTLKTGQMPEPLYLWAHKEARLTKQHRQTLIKWAEQELDFK